MTPRVYEDIDKDEGRGGSILRFTVGNKSDADALAEGLGPMGTPGRVESAEYLCIVFEGGKHVMHVPVASVIEGSIPATARAAVAAQALRKLTPEERAALGLG